MNFKELLEAVKDETLPLPTLEKLRDEMIHLHSMMQIELADLEKKEAIFLAGCQKTIIIDGKTQKISDVSIRRTWDGTKEGLRMIDINRYIKSIVKEIDSLKSRVYRLI